MGNLAGMTFVEQTADSIRWDVAGVLLINVKLVNKGEAGDTA